MGAGGGAKPMPTGPWRGPVRAPAAAARRACLVNATIQRTGGPTFLASSQILGWTLRKARFSDREDAAPHARRRRRQGARDGGAALALSDRRLLENRGAGDRARVRRAGLRILRGRADRHPGG